MRDIPLVPDLWLHRWQCHAQTVMNRAALRCRKRRIDARRAKEEAARKAAAK
ncbi:MAG TPA: hypothetical protein VD931_01040 [Baekduia sp.]|nr:hypothetical protein [Baekduia sp.]